jgi:3-hydroxyisobutyrate dehydrogenase-like beta-hydroxyacid dehydrogenase
MKVGFIGIGAMGRHMSRHVLEAGFELTVNDVRKEAAQEVLAKGAKWADTPEAVASSCEVVLTSLPMPKTVEEVVYGEHGLMKGWKKGDIFVDMSTNSPAVIQKIAKDAEAKGVSVLDAPVSGGTTGAESKRLTVIVGGKKEVLEKVRSILQSMGDVIVHTGDVGCGNIAKLVNNMISFTCNEITAEGMVLGAKAGIDVKILREVIRNSTGSNYFVQTGVPQIFKGDFEPGFRVNLAIKDIGLALGMAKELGIPTPIGAAVEQRLLEARAAGLGDKGTQSLIVLLEKLTGVQVRAPQP